MYKHFFIKNLYRHFFIRRKSFLSQEMKLYCLLLEHNCMKPWTHPPALNGCFVAWLKLLLFLLSSSHGFTFPWFLFAATFKGWLVSAGILTSTSVCGGSLPLPRATWGDDLENQDSHTPKLQFPFSCVWDFHLCCRGWDVRHKWVPWVLCKQSLVK